MKRRIVPRTPSFILLFAAAWTSPLFAQQPSEWPVAAATTELARGNSAAAIALLEPWLASPDAVDAEDKPLAIEALVLRARAREANGEDGKAALADLTTAETLAPDRPHAAQIALQRARIHDRLKQRDQALAAARAAADLLLDQNRRRERAQVWLDAAEVFLKPPADLDPVAKKNFKPNHALAAELLGSALETEALGSDTRRIEVERLSLLTNAEQPSEQRLAKAKELLAKHKDATNEERAKLFVTVGRAARDSQSLEDLLWAARGAAAVPDAAASAIELWNLVTEWPAIILGEWKLRVRREAVVELTRLRATPQQLESAYLKLSEDAWSQRDFAAANDALRLARTVRPDSPRTAEIEIEIAKLLQASGDDEAAVAHLEAFLANRTIDSAGTAVTERLDAMLLSGANSRFDGAAKQKGAEQLEAIARARAAYDRYLARFPATTSISDIMLRQARLKRLEKKFDEALALLGELRNRFPGSEVAREAWMDCARILFEDKKDAKASLALLDLAITADANIESRAKEFRARIEQPELSFESHRPFRSDEPKRITLTARNLGKIEVAAYPVDLQEFFLATGRFDVLATLDVSLIEPMRRSTTVIGSADSHLASSEAIDVGELPPGKAYILSARSGDLEARAVVMTSDLDAAVLRTANDWRVIGIDRKTGATTEIARYRIADSTGALLPADALLPKDLPLDALSLLASAEIGFATVKFDGAKVQGARTLETVSFLLDRTFVRPGESVHAFGRVVDSHRLPTATPIELRVIDESSKQQLLRLRTTSDDHGAFQAELPIDGGLVGNDRNLVVEMWLGSGLGESRVASSTCTVVDGSESESILSFVAGDELIEGEAGSAYIIARDAFGSPIRDLPLTVTLNHEPAQSLRTDSNGSIQLTIPAEQTRERFAVSLEVRSETRAYSFQSRVDTRSPRLRLLRGLASAHFAGTTLRPSLEVTANDRPLQARVDFQLRRSYAGEWQAIRSGSLMTDAAGRGEFAIDVVEPGSYQVTIVTKDRDGSPQEIRHSFTAYGLGASEDLVICEVQKSARPGERFDLPVFWPFAAGPALLTIFGAELDRAEVVTLNPGANVLSITAPKAHVAKCEIRLAPLLVPHQTRTLSVAISPSVEFEVAPPIVAASGATSFEVSARAGSEAWSGKFDYVIVEDSELERVREPVMRILDREWQQIGITLPGVRIGLSADLEHAPVVLATDPRIAEQLALMNRTASDASARPMVEQLALDDMIAHRRLPGEVEKDGPETFVGGGAPTTGGGGGGLGKGKYGGRGSGKLTRNVQPPPLAVGFAQVLDANGRATITVPSPARAGRFAILVISRDGISTATATRTFVVPPERVAAQTAPPIQHARFDGVALSNGGALVLPSSARSDLTTVHAFSTNLAALASLELPGGATDLDVALWQSYRASETVLMARTLELPTKAMAPLEARRDAAFDHLRATLLGVLSRNPSDSDENSPVGRRSGAILFVIATARQSGLVTGPGFENSWIATLDRTLSGATDPSRRTLALAGLARAGAVSFERLNRTLREADTLSRRDLALLVLALIDAKRPEEARAMATKLSARTAPDPEVGLTTFEAPLSSRVEVDALVVSALRRALSSESLPPSIASLFSGTRATRLDESGAALWIWLASQTPTAANFTLRLTSGEKTIEVAVDARDPLLTVELIDRIRALPAGDVTFERADGAPFVLAYATTQHVAANDSRYAVDIRMVRMEAKRDGTLLPVGDSILVDARATDSPHAQKLAIGRNYEVRIAVSRQSGAPRGYWVRVPIPDGLEFVPGSISEATEYVVEDRSLLLYHAATHDDSSRHDLRFRVRPVTARTGVPPLSVGIRSGRFEPEFTASSLDGGFDIVVWDLDVDGSIEATPDERYQVGLAASVAGRHDRAYEWLAPLLGKPLVADAARATLRAALKSVIALGKDREIVDLFELAKERDPSNVLSFDAMNRVSKAYAAIGEIERSREVLSAIGDALFLQEARAVGRLESAGLDRMAMTFLDRLLIEHDSTSTLLETTFAVGQHAYDVARKLGPTPPKVVVLGQNPLVRQEWLSLGKRALEGRLVASGSDTTAEEVALTLGNLLLEADSLDDASALANAARTRYAKGRFGATWHYILAYAAFARRDLATAATQAQALVDAASKATDVAIQKLEKTGNHMLAQIAHANGDLATARKLYSQVKAEITDARLALEYLDRSGLSLPTVWVSGVDQTLEIPLERKVLESQRGEVEVTLYPVDLRLLYLKKRGFETLSSVELAGLPSISRSRVKPVADRASGTERVALGVPAPGAYLVIVRDGDLLARSIAIVSDISIDVTEIAGGARVHVADRSTRKPIPDVVLTFVGSESANFVTRKSDLRGIAEATDLRGTLAVIAQREKQFAYYQGAAALATAASDEKKQRMADSELQDQTDKQLEDARAVNDATYKANFNRVQSGVEVQRANKK